MRSRMIWAAPLALLAMLTAGVGQADDDAGKEASVKGVYDFTMEDIDGNPKPLSDFQGKVVLIVNTASKCGFTPQYEGLQALYETYRDQGFVVLGFPANNFLNQEPGSAFEIRQFCTTNYDVTFPLMEKISVKGKDMHPVYQWLTEKEKNGVMDSNVKWNFQKYLIDENGNLVDVLYSKEKPGSDKVLAWLAEK